MRIFRRTYIDRHGKKKHVNKWTIEFRDHNKKARQISAFSDRVLSQKMGNNIIRIVQHVQAGEIFDAKLYQWINKYMPAAVYNKLIAWGLLNGSGQRKIPIQTGILGKLENGDKYVYLMQCHNHYKIGVSNSPYDRLVAHQTGNPYPIQLIKCVQTKDWKEVEKELQNRLILTKIKGEWFTLDDEQALQLCEIFEEIS